MYCWLIKSTCFIWLKLDDRHVSTDKTLAEVDTFSSDTDYERHDEKGDLGMQSCCFTQQVFVIWSIMYMFKYSYIIYLYFFIVNEIIN